MPVYKYPKGTQVFVPTQLLPDPERYNHALIRLTVERNTRRSIVVTPPGSSASTTIASSRAHPANLGLLVIRVGDLQSEAGVLDPLARSILEFFRLLVPDDQLELLRLRTLHELRTFWNQKHGAFTHVVLIGHGTSDFVPFIDAENGRATGETLATTMTVAGMAPKHMVSLACATGRAPFAKSLSLSACCSIFVAPYQPVHAAAASHFCQTYFTQVLLEGRTTKTAFKRASEAVLGQSHFRLWQSGKIVAGKAS